MIISQIMAASKNGVIGKNGQMPWHIPEDLKYFRTKTSGHILIMGRKTFESLPSPLPKRFHIVITRNLNYKSDHALVKIVSSLDEALRFAQLICPDWNEEIFIVGGGEIYEQSLSKTDRIYLTLIQKEYEGDTFYPLEKIKNFKTTSQVDRNDPVPFSFLVLDRN